MTYYLKYNVGANIEMTHEQFDFLFTAFKASANYFAEAEVGGFMYGNLQRRKAGIDESEFSALELNQALRVLETEHLETEQEKIREKIEHDLTFILNMVNAKAQQLRETSTNEIA